MILSFARIVEKAGDPTYVVVVNVFMDGSLDVIKIF